MTGILVIASATVILAASQLPPPVPAPDDDPYSEHYSDEVARRLGVHEGQLDLLSVPKRQRLLPNVKAGLQRGKPGLQLRWHVD